MPTPGESGTTAVPGTPTTEGETSAGAPGKPPGALGGVAPGSGASKYEPVGYPAPANGMLVELGKEPYVGVASGDTSDASPSLGLAGASLACSRKYGSCDAAGSCSFANDTGEPIPRLPASAPGIGRS